MRKYSCQSYEVFEKIYGGRQAASVGAISRSLNMTF